MPCRNLRPRIVNIVRARSLLLQHSLRESLHFVGEIRALSASTQVYIYIYIYIFNSLVSLVPHRDRFVFRRDMMGAASTALARFRAHAILNACKCISSVNV